MSELPKQPDRRLEKNESFDETKTNEKMNEFVNAGSIAIGETTKNETAILRTHAKAGKPKRHE